MGLKKLVGCKIISKFVLTTTNTLQLMDKRMIDIAYFLSFCIEQYKTAKGISGAEAMQIFDHYGVLEYLSEHYDVLHTQNHHWILEDINEFISLRTNNK